MARRKTGKKPDAGSGRSDSADLGTGLPPSPSIAPPISDHGGHSELRDELRMTTERLGALVDQSPTGLLVHRGREILFANPAAARILNYGAPDDLYTLSSYEQLVAPHDRALVKSYENARLVGGPAPPQYRFDGIRKDGAIIVVLNHAWSAQWDGRTAVIWKMFDVTQDHHAEQSLRESEELLRAIVQSMPLDMNVKDATGRYLMVNAPFLEKMRMTEEAVIGKATWELYSAADAQSIMAHDREVLAAGRARVREFEVTYPDMRTRLESFTRFPIPGGYGRPSKVGVVVLDVTEQRRAEAALRVSDTHHRMLLEHSIEGILVHRDGRPLFVNTTLAEQLGYGNPAEVLAQSDLERHWAADARARLSGQHPTEAAKETKAVPFEMDALRVDGSMLRLHVWLSEINWHSERAILIRTLKDEKEKGSE